MRDAAFLLTAGALGVVVWLILFAIVLVYEHHQLAPACSGGGTSVARGFGFIRRMMLPTPR